MKLQDVRTIMELMREFKVTALKFGDLELAMPPEYQAVESEEAPMTDEELLFYSSTDQ